MYNPKPTTKTQQNRWNIW